MINKDYGLRSTSYKLKPFGYIRCAALLFFVLISLNASPQKIARLETVLPKAGYGFNVPASINLDKITYLSDTLISLYEVRDKERIAVPFQIEHGEFRKLCWIINTGNKGGEKHIYEIVREKPGHFNEITASEDKGALIIHSQDMKLLQYCFKTVYPPSGVDTIFKRSGFIHPLWAPHGEVLTRIQAPDHYHHYGIWNPWTHVLFEGDTVDFWNLGSRQGTVRFAKFVSVENGPVFSGFEALHEHVAFRKGGGEKTALNELQGITVYMPHGKPDMYIVDFEIRLNCACESPVKILEYRYAGLGWRTTEKWDNKNSMVLTSEGKTRKDADGSRAKWCIVQGDIDAGYAGIIMMSYPTNYNFPEPLRIWPENTNNRGDMFANFCPTKNMDWTLYPRENYVLKYRFLVFNGKVDEKIAESAWYYYANPPEITVKVVK